MHVESASNPRIRAIADLRDRRNRLAAGLTVVDGARECLRALASDVTVETAVICPELVRSDDAHAVVGEVARRGIPSLEASERAFERAAYGDRADGTLLVVRVPQVLLADLAPIAARGDALVVVTEDVVKPGNLGAILRSADGAGADAVIAVGGTDLYNPNVVRASVGTIFHLPVVAAEADETLAWLRAGGFHVVAARVDAAHSWAGADLRGRTALVLGSEAEGLSDAWNAPDVEGVARPMLGVADSLNVSVTAAVLLYEARRQRMEV